MLTQNQIEKILQAIDETNRKLNKELNYLPQHQKIEEIIALRVHKKMLTKKIEDNAAATYLKKVACCK